MTSRNDIVMEARSWIGTPFHHMARMKGVGVDCVGLLIGVSRALALVSHNFDVPAYSQIPDGKTMLNTCDRYMRPIPRPNMKPGDVVVLIVDKEPQHVGILGDYRHGGFSIIHAALMAAPPRVIETRLMWSRNQRFVAAYALPGIT